MASYGKPWKPPLVKNYEIFFRYCIFWEFLLFYDLSLGVNGSWKSLCRRDGYAFEVIAIVFVSFAMSLMVAPLTVSMLRILPTVPRLYWTTWPSDCDKLVNDQKTKHAHLLSSIFSGGTISTALYRSS